MSVSVSVNNSSGATTCEEDIFIMPCSDLVMKSEDMTKASNIALLRALQRSGVQFVRYVAVDSSNNLRSKVAPMKRLIADSKKGKALPFHNALSIAEVCFGGLPSYGDVMLDGTTLDAKSVLTVQPDLSTLRVLPYSPKTAMVLGTLHDQRTHQLSNICTRGLLSRVLQTAARDFGLAFSVGAELEFVLVKDEGAVLPEGKMPTAIDASVFANTTTLNDQEDFISDVYGQLEQQDIEVELIHAESAPGQLEIVLKYQDDALVLADNVIFARETIRSVARGHGMRALFLPKMNAMLAGNGLHLHFSFRDLNSPSSNSNAFPDRDSIGKVSPKGGSFVEGILCRLPALLAVTIPSSNSFRRVGRGCWTGHSVSWNTEDKESPLRVCLDLESGEATNVELKLSDSMANIYLEIASVLLAGLDGIQKNLKLRPAENEEEEDGVSADALPTTLNEALEAFQNDDFWKREIGEALSRNYVVLRSAEAALSRTIEEEVIDAYQKA